MNISVLMSVYINENPKHLEESLKSLANQTKKPYEVVLVQDGQLLNEHHKIIEKWTNKLNIVNVCLEKNKGLGIALNTGIKHCKSELIARFDTDDISIPTRLEIQHNFMTKNEHISLCGSHIYEFDHNISNIIGKRTVPIGIITKKNICYRNPFNHMTVIFRKSAVIKAGGYKPLNYMEDYYLWIRMFSKNMLMANLDEQLVYARTGNNMILRRSGYKYSISELILLYKLFNLKLSKNILTPIFFIARAIIRLLPISIISIIYKTTRS